MDKSKVDYSKHYEDRIVKEVLPTVTDEIKAVDLAKKKQNSLNIRFNQNEQEAATLETDLLTLRSESVEHVMSEKKSEAYVQKMSKIKGRIVLLKDANAEIQNHLIPAIENELDEAYRGLVAAANSKISVLGNQIREEIFNAAMEGIKKIGGFHAAFYTLSTKMLDLPTGRHRLDFDVIPHFPALEDIIQDGKDWVK